MSRDWTQLGPPPRHSGRPGPPMGKATPRVPKKKIPPADGVFVEEMRLAAERKRLAERNRPPGDGLADEIGPDGKPTGRRVPIEPGPAIPAMNWAPSRFEPKGG